jgi:transcriptional regulator with XRE-family HTH domain
MEAKMKKESKDNSFSGYLDSKLKNKSFREAYEHYRDVIDIGLQIRDLRESAGLTQKKLAESLGVSQQVIARLENGDANNPTVSTLERIANATGHRLRFKFEPTSNKRPSSRGATRKARGKGSDFDAFLKEEGIDAKVKSIAKKRILAFQNRRQAS